MVPSLPSQATISVRKGAPYLLLAIDANTICASSNFSTKSAVSDDCTRAPVLSLLKATGEIFVCHLEALSRHKRAFGRSIMPGCLQQDLSIRKQIGNSTDYVPAFNITGPRVL